MNTNLFDLTEKNAIVIGGSNTLVSSMVEGLANHGATVALVGRSMSKLKQVEDKIKHGGLSNWSIVWRRDWS
jgi:short-subunit dehydrogenase